MVNPLGLTGRKDENLFHKELSEVYSKCYLSALCLAFLDLTITYSEKSFSCFKYSTEHMILSCRSSLFLYATDKLLELKG